MLKVPDSLIETLFRGLKSRYSCFDPHRDQPHYAECGPDFSRKTEAERDVSRRLRLAEMAQQILASVLNYATQHPFECIETDGPERYRVLKFRNHVTVEDFTARHMWHGRGRVDPEDVTAILDSCSLLRRDDDVWHLIKPMPDKRVRLPTSQELKAFADRDAVTRRRAEAETLQAQRDRADYAWQIRTYGNYDPYRDQV